MKKFALSLLYALCLSFSVQAQIVISEIMYNPPESNTDSLEYIELYNNGNASVNLENWSLFGVTFTFPAITLAPNQYIVTSVNAGALQNVFGVTSIQWAGGGLNNNGEPVRLLDAGGNIIDEVTYSSMAPWPVGAASNGTSLVLCDPNSDNSLPASWQAATTSTGVTINGKEVFGNPGAASGCQTVVTALNDQFFAAAGESVTLAVLANDVLPGQGTPVVTIAVQPQHGTATVNGDNTINYTATAGYAGTDVLTYKICENTDCDEAQANLTVKVYPAYSIDQVNNINIDGVADSLGKVCKLTANVYGVNLRPTGLQFTMIDDSNNGITVFNGAGNLGYTVKEKDKITVFGTINQFNGLIQIFPDLLKKVSANNTLVNPPAVITHDEGTESKLIRINNLNFVDTAQWTPGLGTGFSVFMVSPDFPLDTIQVRIDDNVDLFNVLRPATPFNLTGIGGQFDASLPYTSGYQIAPRYTQDISTLVGAKEADFSASVQISPNPASEVLLIQSDRDFDRIWIFNTAGQLTQLVSDPMRQTRIHLRDWAPGVYFARFEKDGAVWTTRFVKQ